MANISDLAREAFGNDCTIETNSQFLSLYLGERKMAVINTIKHRMILASPDFLESAQKFSEEYKQVQEIDNFTIFASYL